MIESLDDAWRWHESVKKLVAMMDWGERRGFCPRRGAFARGLVVSRRDHERSSRLDKKRAITGRHATSRAAGIARNSKPELDEPFAASHQRWSEPSEGHGSGRGIGDDRSGRSRLVEERAEAREAVETLVEARGERVGPGEGEGGKEAGQARSSPLQSYVGSKLV